MFAIGRATILHPYLDFARQIGIPWETELERCRLPLRSDKNLDSWLPYSRIEDFIEAMVHREPDIVSPLSSLAIDPSESFAPSHVGAALELWKLIAGARKARRASCEPCDGF